ncbi:MAG: hypothetical protein IKU20_10855 [Lachnospiraceae bacterium]|nr:hypothetical protein [Lachnospiraceae bacterium]
MRNWKRIAATILAASMMVSSTMVSMAAEPITKGDWLYDEATGDWYFYDEEGILVQKSLVDNTGLFYVNEDGVMVTDEWVQDEKHWYYATSSGQLATDKWVCTWDYDDEEHKEEKYWYFFKKSGKMMRNDFKTDKHGSYYLGNDGKMISDKLLEVTIEDEENPENNETHLIYAYPDGHLAKSEWIILDSEEKTLTYNEVEGDWYFFDDNGYALQDGAEEVGDGYFLFDEDGVMLRATWDEAHEYYYEMSGFRMTPTRTDEEEEFFKWRFTDRGWFAFNEEGHAQEFQIASGSNAPHPMVYDVQFIADDEVDLTEVPVGEKVELTFEIEMDIDGAEVKKFRKGHHDIWVEKTFEEHDTPKLFANSTRVKEKEVVNVEDGIAQITYTYEATLPGTTKVKLIVDGMESTTATITTVEAPEPVSDARVNDLLNPEDADAVAGFEKERIDALKALVNEENENAAENKEVLFAVFANNESSVSSLESSYAMANGIEVADPEVSEEAKALLGGEDAVASVIGVALNMEDSGTAQMKVGEGEEKELDKEFDKTASFDISVEVDGENVSEFTTPIIIKISVPDGFDPDKLVIYHFHGDSDEAEELDFTVNGNVISIVVDKLSTFVFAEGEQNTDNDGNEDDNISSNDPAPTPNDDDEPAYTKDYLASMKAKEEAAKEETTAGQWIQNENGWLFKAEDGSYPANEWKKLTYNGKTDWYRFNADGYMATGWFTAADGNIYYLNPISNGFQGAMLTGWQLIDGFWYYFNPVDDAIQGAMYRNTTTPDGYQVDANGRWVQ